MDTNSPRFILFIDYENIQSLDLSKLYNQEIHVKVFVGANQLKIPLKTVQDTQKFGDRLEWIAISGSGNNALDFHIAFYLGQLSQDFKKSQFFILSKDKGFDALIHHMNQQKFKSRRIENLLELVKDNDQSDSEKIVSQSPKTIDSSVPKLTLKENLSIVENHLSRIAKNKRPRARKTLHQYIKSLLLVQKLNAPEIDRLIDELFKKNQITELNSRLTYHF